jgi:hypothetical protein
MVVFQIPYDCNDFRLRILEKRDAIPFSESCGEPVGTGDLDRVILTVAAALLNPSGFLSWRHANVNLPNHYKRQHRGMPTDLPSESGLQMPVLSLRALADQNDFSILQTLAT